MPSPADDNLERAIDQALAAEPWRPAPMGLYRRIQTRLHIEALRMAEQRRFRAAALLCGTVCFLLLGGLAASFQAYERLAYLTDFVPGVQGMADSFLSVYGRIPVHLSSAELLIWTAGAGAVMFATMLCFGLFSSRQLSQ